MKLTYKYIQPRAELASVIDRFWIIENTSSHIETFEVLPDHCFDLIYQFEEGTYRSTLITGIFNQIIQVDIKPNTILMGINFYPIALQQFFNISLHNLLGQYRTFDASMLANLEQYPTINLYGANQLDALIETLQGYLINNQNVSLEIPGYYRDERVKDVVASTDLSEKALRRWYQKWFGLSPQNYINLARMVKARHLLLNTTLSLTEIAFELSYYDQAHFIKAFKAVYHQSPQSFRHLYNLSDFYNPKP